MGTPGCVQSLSWFFAAQTKILLLAYKKRESKQQQKSSLFHGSLPSCGDTLCVALTGGATNSGDGQEVLPGPPPDFLGDSSSRS